MILTNVRDTTHDDSLALFELVLPPPPRVACYRNTPVGRGLTSKSRVPYDLADFVFSVPLGMILFCILGEHRTGHGHTCCRVPVHRLDSPETDGQRPPGRRVRSRAACCVHHDGETQQRQSSCQPVRPALDGVHLDEMFGKSFRFH